MNRIIVFRYLPVKKVAFRILLCLVVLLAVENDLPAQEKEKDKEDDVKTYQHIDLSYIFGGQLYNDNFIYNPGVNIHMSHGYMIHKDIGVGLGAGYTSLQNENFVPLYFEAIGYKKKKSNTPLIKFQAGWSFGWNKNSLEHDNYDMKGGLYINAGLGRKINLNKTYSLLFHWSYCHQFASAEYTVYNDRLYSELLNYDMFFITLGLIRE